LNADDPGELYDSSNLTAFIMKIWETNFGTGSLLLDSSSASYISACSAVGAVPVTFEHTATAAQFVARQKSQITIYCPASTTANVTAGARFGVLTGASQERATEPDWFGDFNVTSREVGLSSVATPPVPAELYVRSDVFQAADANNVKFGKNKKGRTITLVSRSGLHGRTLGVDDNAKPIDVRESYP
jgi:hypothetical protein